MHSKYWPPYLAEGMWCLSLLLPPIHWVFAGHSVIFFFNYFILFRPKLQLSLAYVFGSFGLHDSIILKSICLRNCVWVRVWLRCTLCCLSVCELYQSGTGCLWLLLNRQQQKLCQRCRPCVCGLLFLGNTSRSFACGVGVGIHSCPVPTCRCNGDCRRLEVNVNVICCETAALL